MPHPIARPAAASAKTASAPPPPPPPPPPPASPGGRPPGRRRRRLDPPDDAAAANPSESEALSDARSFASSAFRSHVASTLRGAALSSLRGTLLRRVRGRFRTLNRSDPERLANSSVEELVGEDPDLRRVSEEDVGGCRRFAARVGRRWSEVLRREGCLAFAAIALEVVEGGRFLEEPSDSSAEDDDDGGGGASDEASGTKGRPSSRIPAISARASAHSALRSLRRHPPECDGSGSPLDVLPDREPDDASSARRVVLEIDRLASEGRTEWRHGWDAIDEACRRNVTRMEYGRERAGVGGGEYDVVPKGDRAADAPGGDEGGARGDAMRDAMGGDEGGGEGGGKCGGAGPARRKVVRFEAEGMADGGAEGEAGGEAEARKRNASDVTFLLSANKQVAKILKRRRLEREAAMKDEPGAEATNRSAEATSREGAPKPPEGGRPPSSLGEETWNWQEVVTSAMDLTERRELIAEATHPPHPFEPGTRDDAARGDDDGKDGGDEPRHPEEHDAVICGALKEFGRVHLWERTRSLPTDASDADGDGDGASKAGSDHRARRTARARRRALNRATKERLGRRKGAGGIGGGGGGRGGAGAGGSESGRRSDEGCSSFSAGGGAGATTPGKVRWTEDDDDDGARTVRGGEVDGEAKAEPKDEGRGDEDLDDGLDGARRPPAQRDLGKGSEETGRRRQWLDMDLGECSVELANDADAVGEVRAVGGADEVGGCEGGGAGEEEGGSRGGGGTDKVFWAFRSVEVALRF